MRNSFWKKLGIIGNSQRYRGHIKFPQKFTEFPFDSQRLTISIKSVHSSDYCQIESSPISLSMIKGQNDANFTEYCRTKVQLPEWGVEYANRGEENYGHASCYSIEMTLKRKSAFYVKSIVSLVFIICVLGWCMYFITPESISQRLQVSITLFLAQVAFNFIVYSVR